MSSRFNVLLHGDASEAAAILGGDNPQPDDLRPALTNALDRIAELERKYEALRVKVAYKADIQ